MPLGFLGEYPYRIDSKGRLPLPPKFRERFSQGGVLARGLERCIRVYPLSEWEKMAERFASLPQDRSKYRALSRYIFGTAFDFELDGQGRLALPLPLREYAEIKEAVTIVGANTYLELWGQGSWEEERARVEEEAARILESHERRE